jgi:hypothetical protein
MAAGYSDQYLEQGATFNSQLTLADAYGNPYNLNSFTIASQAKKSYYSSNVSINFVTSIYNANNGIIQLSLGAANTANIPAGNYVYDVTIKDPTGIVTRVLEGKIYVAPGVTNVTTSYGSDV